MIGSSAGSSRDTWGSPQPPSDTEKTPASTPDTLAANTTSANSASAPQTDVAVSRVLVIESDVETADAIVDLLERAGYKVEIATDASYGLLLAESFVPHVILIGSEAQRLNPHELTQTLRNAPQFAARFRDASLIYIANNRSLIQQRFHALPDTPLSAYIFKPIDAHELLEKVSRTLARCGA